MTEHDISYRKAEETDIAAIMGIIADAQAFLRSQGLSQWQNGYPDVSIIRNDISHGECYVTIGSTGIKALAVFAQGIEDSYNIIYSGNWLTSAQNYITIHRCAVARGYYGLKASDEIFALAEIIAQKRNVPSIRIDTHEGNMPMLNAITRNGFEYCGEIYLDGCITYDNRRKAFEKIVH